MSQSNYTPAYKVEKLGRKVAITFLVAVLLKLWLVEAHEIYADRTPHDGLLFAFQAYNLLDGNWLGSFNDKTLIKGIGNPLFIATAYWLGIPLLTAYQLLYTFVCLTVVYAVKPLVRNRSYLVFLFLILLFNPFSNSYPLMSSTMRASVYVSMTLLCLGSMIGLWHRSQRSAWGAAKWALLFSLSFTMLWITREEMIWFVPVYICFGLVYILPWSWNAGLSVKLRACLFAAPLVLYAIVYSSIAALNYHYYGVRVVNELKSKEFVSALGGLMNVKPKVNKRHTVVSLYAENQAIKASPSLAELKPFLGKSKWPASFYIWKFRSAASKSGYYDLEDDAKPALDLYRRIGDEIASACESGELDCLERKPTLRPPWYKEYNELVLPTFLELASRAVNFNRFNADSSKFSTDMRRNFFLMYDYVTGEHPERKYTNIQVPDFERKMTAMKEYVLGRIGKIFRYLVPLLFLVAVFFHARMLLSALFSKRLKFQPVFGIILFGGGLSVLAMLTFVKITLWNVVRPLYVIYPIVLLYIVWMLAPLQDSQSNQTTAE